MPTVTITLAGTKAPEAGKKRGRIQSTDGMIFQIDPMMAAGLQLNQTYTVNYLDDEFRGAKFRVVEDIKPSTGALPHTPMTMAEVARTVAAPMKSEGTMSAKEEELRQESIAAQSILKCQGPLPVGDTASILHALKAGAMAWREFRKWQRSGNISTGARPSLKDEMDDGLPPGWGPDGS